MNKEEIFRDNKRLREENELLEELEAFWH